MTLDTNTTGFNGSNAVALLDAAAEAYQEQTPCNRPHPGPPHEPERLLSPSLSSILNGGEGGRRPGEEVFQGSGVQGANRALGNSLPQTRGPAAADQVHTLCDPRTDAQACIRDLDNCVVVAFRGSQAPVDFVQDAKFKLAEYLWMHDNYVAEVHAGFLEDFQAIGGQVVDCVKTLLAGHDSFRPVYVTGHSLGGALAILCALEFVREKIPVTGVYTFGQPRVGNRTFAGLYDARLADKTWRVVNANDIVPRLPGVLLGYRHCGHEVLLIPGGDCLLNPPRWQTALSDVVGLSAAFRRRQDVLISEHFLAAYRLALGQDAIQEAETTEARQ